MPVTIKLPFDEASGSPVAYDYSGNNKHASILGGDFIQGRIGNCVYFPNSGSARIPDGVLDLAGDFTFMFMAMAEFTAYGPTKTWVLFRFSPTRYIRLELHTILESWTHVAITKQGNTLRTFVNSQLIDSEDIPESFGVATGFVILNDNGFSDAGRDYIDNFEIRQGEALSNFTENIQYYFNMSEPVYYINGIDFKTFGVRVKKLSGITDELAVKDPLKFNWEGYHGEQIDLLKPMLDIRTIEMECWIRGIGRTDYTAQWHNFRAQLRGPNTKRLMIQLIEKPLVYEVYNLDSIPIDQDWIDGEIYGVFNLKLKEPSPVKRVLKFTKTDAENTLSITITSKKLLSVFWGDGTRTRDVYGVDKVVTHQYATNGDYYIIVAGNIEEITKFEANAVVVWNRL